MNFLVEGGTLEQATLLEEAAEVYAKKLMPDFWKELTLEIVLIKNLYKKENVKADMILIDDDEEYHREFEIRMDCSMNHQALLRALAHEMVHVKQYATQEIVDVDANHVKWYGKKLKYDTRTFTWEGYWNMPWEIEAYGKETGLLEEFIYSKGYDNKRWYRDMDYVQSKPMP